MYKQSLFAIAALAALTSNSYANDKLDDVVVTAKSEKSIKDLAGSINIITAEDIAKLNATNIKDVLVKTSGVVESSNEASTYGRKGISIRGLDSSYSLILIDGKKVNPTDGYIKHSDYQYGWIPTSMIDRIEVIKGPKSSIYGSQAIGGVVNIITKKDTSKLYGELDVQAGVSTAKKGGDERKFNANVGGNITEELSFILGLSRNDREVSSGKGLVYGSPSNNATYIEGLESTDGTLMVNYDIDDTQAISASYLKGKESRELYDEPNYYTLERDMYNLSYEKDFKDFSFNIDYARSKSDNEYNSGSRNYIHTLTDSSLKGEVKVSKIKNNYIVVGAEHAKEEYDKTYISSGTDFSADVKTNAFYIQDEIELGEFILTLGARYDKNEKYGSDISSNVGLVYKLTENQRIKANYGEGFKAPSMQEGSSEYVSSSHGGSGAEYYTGNDDLEAETSKTYEISYEFYGEDTEFKAALFSTKLDNMITGDLVSITYPYGPGYEVKNYTYVNVAKANSKGLELEFEYDINDNHQLTTNYTYVKTEDEETGKELMYKPKNTLNLGLSSKLDYGFSSYVNISHTGSQYDAEGEKFSGYTLANAQISRKITENLTMRIGMDNITDKHFDDDDGEPYYVKRRFTYIGLNYKF